MFFQVFPHNLSELVLNPITFENPFMSIQLFGLKIYGFITSTDQKFWKLHNLRAAFFTTCFIMFNISQYVDLIQSWGCLNDLMMNAPTTLLFSTTVARMLNFYRYRDRYVALIKEADEDINEIWETSTVAEKRIISHCINYARRLIMGFICIALLTANTMCVYSFVQSFFYDPNSMCSGKVCSPPTILRSWVGTEKVWEYFYWIYSWQIYNMWLGQIIVPCWHTFIAGLMIYSICNLKLLNYKLKNYGKFVDKDDENGAVEVLKSIIERHKKVVRFVRELIDLNGWALFLDFVIFSALLCALLFQTAKVSLLVPSRFYLKNSF